MSPLNFFIVIIIGFIIGLLTELLMEVFYFRGRRKQVRDERITQLETDLAARDEELAQLHFDLEGREARITDLEGRLTRGQERLNALQREVALQRQRTQVAAEITPVDEGDVVAAPILQASEAVAEAAEPVDTRFEAVNEVAAPIAQASEPVVARVDSDDESYPTTRPE